MRSAIAICVLLFVGMLLPAGGPATAADVGAMRPADGTASVLPFPRSARAAAVWGEGACWRECQATCTWGLAGCLSLDTQGRCVRYTNACDRSCQRECRARGGPYVDPLFDALD